MTSPLFGITADTARIGMDALAMRQLVAAQNIAQANLPGARPLQVSFASQLKAAAASAERDGQWMLQLAESVANVAPTSGGRAGLDAQVVELNEVGVHYQALARAVGRHFSMLSLAINEGKRS